MSSEDPFDPANRDQPAPLRAAALRAFEDRMLARQQRLGRVLGLEHVVGRQRPDGRMAQVPIGRPLQLRHRRPIPKRACDFCQCVPARKRVVHRRQAFGARQPLREHVVVRRYRRAPLAAGERVNLGVPKSVLGRPRPNLIAPARLVHPVVLRSPGRKRDPLRPLTREVAGRDAGELGRPLLNLCSSLREVPQHRVGNAVNLE